MESISKKVKRRWYWKVGESYNKMHEEMKFMIYGFMIYEDSKEDGGGAEE